MPLIRLQNESDIQKCQYYEFDPKVKSNILGEGGMGIVFKGKLVHSDTGQFEYVAIKVLFKGLSEESITRAQREASIQIVHENIVRMYDFIETTDADGTQRYHVISEYLEGETLDTLLKKQKDGSHVFVTMSSDNSSLSPGGLPQYQALKIVKNILAALYMLHCKGYIHRDIDPSNVMMCTDGKVKLIDFGIARQIADYHDEFKRGTQDGRFIGKVNYASPEQAEGKHWKTNETSDIYSTGILLYQLLVGELPFTGTTYEIIQGHRKQPILFNNAISKELKYVIRKATAKEQKDRYQSAAEFITDIEKIERGISPVPKSWRKLVLFVFALSVAVILGIGAWIYLDKQTNKYTDIIAKASNELSICMYQNALKNYQAAYRIQKTDDVASVIKMLEYLNPAVLAYYNSEYTLADSLFRLAADHQSADAYYYLGEMCYEGVGTPKNFEKGLGYTEKAAGLGSRLADYRLGIIYKDGLSLASDENKASQHFDKARVIIDRGVEANNPELLFIKGEMYMHGNGVRENEERAFEYYEQAAEQGYPRAQYALYELLADKDNVKAQSWLNESAKQGYPKAQYKLWSLLIGEEQYKQGYEWLHSAAGKNYSDALRSLGAVYRKTKGHSGDIPIQKGLDITPDDSISVLHTLKAVEYDFDNYTAMYQLGINYLEGIGVSKNEQEADRYFMMAYNKIEQMPFKLVNGQRIYKDEFAETIRAYCQKRLKRK